MTIAERIYSASTSEEASKARLAETLARRIEDDIASSNILPGGVMGSLRELSERYSAGRAAAREAVALLERRGLGRLRPGPCGGFVVTRPQCQTIGVELANYFRMTGIDAAHLKDARESIDLMVASRVASMRLPRERIERVVVAGSGLDWHLRLRAELARLTDEPVLELFVHCLNDLTADFATEGSADEGEPADESRLALCKALAAGNADAAAQIVGALNASLNGHLRQEGRSTPLPAIETGRQADDRTLSTLVARKLAAEIRENGKAGELLGSEWDLCERYSVSRATFRQAVRQLQDIGLIEGRRGRGNGLVIRKPRGTGSIRLMLAYLIGEKMDPLTAGTILFQLNRFVPALALSRADKRQRARLETLLDRVQRQDPIDRCDLLKLVQCVSELADSPIIDLFSRCLAAYEARFHPALMERLPAHVQAEYFSLLRTLLNRLDGEDALSLADAKRLSSRVLVEMSRTRPL